MSLASVVRPAWRSLRRSPAFTLTASMTLVIGIGAAVAIFALVNGVLLRPLPYGEPDRLVGVWHNLPGVSIAKGNQTAGTYFTYKQLAQSIEGIGVYQTNAVNLSDARGGEPQRVRSTDISASLIPVLKVSPLIGRTFTEAEDRPNGPRVVIINEGLWRSRFGADSRVVGRTLDVSGRNHEIVGVMPSRFQFPNDRVQLWLPLQLDPNAEFPGGFNYDAVARLRPGISVADAQRDFAAALPRMVEISPNFVPGISTQGLLEMAK